MSTLEGRNRLDRLADTLLAQSEADETEVLVTSGEQYLTRFAGNAIHQNVGTRRASVTVRAVLGQRIGVAECEGFEPDRLRATLEQACRIARVVPPTEDFRGLPGPRKIRPIHAWDNATAACTPDDRARLVERLTSEATRREAGAAGLASTDAGEVYVANSRGVRAYHRATSAQFQTVTTCGDGSGYAASQSHALGKLDARRVIRDGVGKATASRKPAAIDPGEIDVVLEPAAVGELVHMLAFIGFGAKAVQEGRSFVSGRMGERITGQRITLADSARDRRQKGVPFDFEGVPRKRVKLIDGGVATGAVYDSYLAGREPGRRASTGHALPPQYRSYGALPTNLVLSGGDASLDELIAGVERGLLVTRFHYVNVAERMRAVLTGMTRDGTFLIRDGEVAGPVRNLRFTESVLEAFDRADGLGRECRLTEDGVACPAMRIRGFRFTGKTEF